MTQSVRAEGQRKPEHVDRLVESSFAARLGSILVSCYDLHGSRKSWMATTQLRFIINQNIPSSGTWFETDYISNEAEHAVDGALT